MSGKGDGVSPHSLECDCPGRITAGDSSKVAKGQCSPCLLLHSVGEALSITHYSSLDLCT